MSKHRGASWLERSGWFAAGCAAALAVSVAAAQGVPDTLYRKLEVLAEVMSAVENHYVDAVSPESLVYGAARGAVLALDAHSDFFAPEDYQSLLSNTEGEYAGIGIELGEGDGEPRVVTVFEDSPAAKAGIAPGDRLVTIDEQEVSGLSFDGIQRLLRGPVGTKVVIHIRRGEGAAPRAFTVVRGWIRIAPLEDHALGGGAHYVHVKSFSRRVTHDLETLLRRKQPLSGLVLDLRGNPGGLFDEAVAMCDLFLDGGPIVSVVGRGGRVMDEQRAHSRNTQPPYPIAILIDGGSASAAEVVAGALRDRGRARLFGTRSYGKGSVQSIVDLSDGSGLKLTIARYYTPSGKRIDGHGVDPDTAVEEGKDALPPALEWIRGQAR